MGELSALHERSAAAPLPEALARLPAPQLIESLNYEAIVTRMRDALVEKDPALSELTQSDPVIKLLEVAAWREYLLRQRINEAARSNLLAFATQGDLDQLGALYGVERQASEEDTGLRQRLYARINGFSSAGSLSAYRYHALSVSPLVKDARCDSPQPGWVRIAVLPQASVANDAAAVARLLTQVKEHVTSESVRVLTDHVVVQVCKTQWVQVDAQLCVAGDAMAHRVCQRAQQQLVAALEAVHGLGRPLHRSWLIAQLFVAGVEQVTVRSPAEDVCVGMDAYVVVSTINVSVAGASASC